MVRSFGGSFVRWFARFGIVIPSRLDVCLFGSFVVLWYGRLIWTPLVTIFLLFLFIFVQK